jgi:hypothetical protein
LTIRYIKNRKYGVPGSAAARTADTSLGATTERPTISAAASRFAPSKAELIDRFRRDPLSLNYQELRTIINVG